jgi:hypothetical protein
MMASGEDQLSCVELLLAAGADVNLYNKVSNLQYTLPAVRNVRQYCQSHRTAQRRSCTKRSGAILE